MANSDKLKCPMCECVRVTRIRDLYLCDDCSYQWPVNPQRDEPLFRTEKETNNESDQKFQVD